MQSWQTNWGWLPAVHRLQQLQQEVDRLIGDTLGRDGGSEPAFPPLNVWTADEEVRVTAEVPGVDPNSLDLSVVNDTLAIRGNRQTPAHDEQATWHRRERQHGNFSRTVQLPYPADPDKVHATYENGILTIRLQRAAEARPRKIEVKAG